jgi:hypothetical protein
MKKIIIVAISLFLVSTSIAQVKKSMAVANPHVEGLDLTSELAAKMIQLELIKIDKFLVYDEFDMAEVLQGDEKYTEKCYGLNCLTSMGKELKVDYIMSGSFTNLGNKIAVSLKWIDVKSEKLYKSVVREFDNQEGEVQRMVRLLLLELNGMEVDAHLKEQLKFQNEMIVSNDVGKVNNSGPRVGVAFMAGSFNEFATRAEAQGGLDIFPMVSNIGYQWEGQYVGTENFSAIIEGIVNVSGLEQGRFLPSVSILNGFRFGKAGWEFAFGPSFTLKKTTQGFFDKDDKFGNGKGSYFSESDWEDYANTNYKINDTDSTYYSNGSYSRPSAYDVTGDANYQNKSSLDARGNIQLSANWLMAFGRTFKAGSLNIPVNVYYSSSKSGGNIGMSVGFNVVKSRSKINGIGRAI